jgi:hypothetical protein
MRSKKTLTRVVVVPGRRLKKIILVVMINLLTLSSTRKQEKVKSLSSRTNSTRLRDWIIFPKKMSRLIWET